MILQKYIGKRIKVVFEEDKTTTIYGILKEFDDDLIELVLDNGKPQLIPRTKIYKMLPQEDELNDV